MIYIYQADVYCEECGEAICKQIGGEFSGLSETEYDSDEFPKQGSSGEKCDCPQHCGSGEECINAIELSDGHKIGAWLENELTNYGVQYVKEAIEEGGEVAELWAEWYADYL